MTAARRATAPSTAGSRTSPAPEIQRTWGDDPAVLHIARWLPRCGVLGPGARAVVWVQGCPFRCRNCVAPETLPFEGGETKRVDEVVDFLAGAKGIEGVTFSGGEPFAQAPALVAVLERLASRRPGLSAMSFTGYTLDWLRAHGSPAQVELLARLDVLVDGPYIPQRHTDLRWRGSSNQQVHLLTERYRHLELSLADRGTWLEFDVAEDGSLAWSGIPPAGFREEFETAMADAGVDLHITPTRTVDGDR